MQLFYNADISLDTKNITFDKTESRHIVRVLRKKEDDILKITNGKELLFDAKIIIANDKRCLAEIVNAQKKVKPWHYNIHIAIAPTKNNDRIEWFLEKATEIGIDEITPIICQNSERRIVKLERFEKIIQAAMKQSLKFTLPKLNAPLSFNEFINQDFDGKCCIAHCEEGKKETLKSILTPSEKIIIMIGPEGDFSSKEIQEAIQRKITPISLGNSRLRTETAALVAVNTVSLLNQ